MMKVLSFDTSSKALSVALLDGESLMAESLLAIKKNHSTSLMPTIDFLMTSVGWQAEDLERIVVAKGPGSYTGLRVAVATAKMLAYSLGIDLVGVSSLYALTGEADKDELVVPIMDARRQNVYVGFYQNGESLMADRHASFEEVLEVLKGRERVHFVGETALFEDVIKEGLPKAKVSESFPNAALIGLKGQYLSVEDIDAFVPNYAKRVEAEENWLKTHTLSGNEHYVKRV
ncbi:tRNA (adenosine(37)-N6)-threonylcarbamoyltransferase complex dimerization subunit type 1 TsaB [Streptococcus sp. zg-JUN1979]|uniref:tRNA (adenosine(37)-N6)-threonylcarbamoyltransferase complex dimerization subunit type 1 TsaB n=1 Tax=Streptococcus sp. zg-JUN1979 TaxID=3391450 RepID=UPI0039A47BD1